MMKNLKLLLGVFFVALMALAPLLVSAQDYELEELEEGFHEEVLDEDEFESTTTPDAGVQLPAEALKPASSKSSEPADVFDEEEFEGFDQPKKAASTTPTDAKEAPSVAPPPRTYYVEAIYVVALLLYGINYIVGKRQNETMAKSWALAFRDLFDSNFSKVGETAILTKLNQYNYRMKCTGRVNCVGLQAELKLHKRQDLFSRLATLLVSSPDRLIIEVPLLPEHMEPFIFAVVKKKDEKQFRKDNADIAAYADVVASPLPKEFSVFTDTEEVAEALLHDHVLATIPKYSDLFVSLHFTDQSASPNYKRLLRFEYLLPAKAKDMDQLSTLLRMSLHFIDLIARTNLSTGAKAKNEKRRSKATEAALKASHQQRQESIQKRKQEQQQKELEELRNLSPEAQQRREEKMQKKAMKKKLASRFKVVHG